ncbi:hypothetical protein AMTR_s00008p00231160 [Amborella trichopoda]|uniref:Uncharacterized protein n=1 Tax=Amborella trichopoda TaxID=13333 RepID=W1NJP7_AMBTC|nr:hypothetical protein AMTR_s00008p00231160 [Amborella trichopoda]
MDLGYKGANALADAVTGIILQAHDADTSAMGSEVAGCGGTDAIGGLSTFSSTMRALLGPHIGTSVMPSPMTSRASLRSTFGGVFRCTKHADRVMIPRNKDCMISIASTAAMLGGLASHAYAASKHAVVGITKNANLKGSTLTVDDIAQAAVYLASD